MASDRRPDPRDPAAALRLDGEALAAIRAHVGEVYPEEACGGLLGRTIDGGPIRVHQVAPLTNTRDDERRRRYLIGPEDVLELERRAEAADIAVVGYYHSHPDAAAQPSEFDREHAWPWYVYVIVEVSDGRPGRVTAWRLADDRTAFEPVRLVQEATSEQRARTRGK